MIPTQLHALLLEQWKIGAEHGRGSIERDRMELEAQIAKLDEQWIDTLRKHKAALETSSSEAWTNSLLAAHAERQVKYKRKREVVEQRLMELRLPPDQSPPDLSQFDARIHIVDAEIDRYCSTLAVKRRQLEYVGDYGSIENDKWLAEVAKFLERNPSLSMCRRELYAMTGTMGIQFDWTQWMMSYIDHAIHPAPRLPEPQRSDGLAFERACLGALNAAGWEGSLTKATGDQGVDIIARKGGLSIAVQCKDHNIPIGNGAVQQVHAGRSFHEADFAVVVSPSGFTESATQLAQKLGVWLVDPSALDSLDALLSRRSP
jgi:hypothetical protein